MSVREYVGARYVPLFVGEWDNSKTYEPLTVVTYQGNSYTSRQYIPVGVDIANADFWAPSGNYNAQIEQYRRDVWAFNGRITNLETIAEYQTGEFNIYELNSRYSLTLVQADGKNIVFECGDADASDSIDSFFVNHDVTHIDALIITHYHGDHYSGFDTVANYCDATTDIFVQMETSDANDDYSDYVTGRAFCDGVIATHGLKPSIIPLQGSVHEYGLVKLKFWNTNVAYCGAYDTAYGNTSRALDTSTTPATVSQISTLNNYSLVTRVEYGNNSYVDTGDIEGAAQERLAEFMQPCTVAKLPHHLVNRMGYLRFFDKLSPLAWIVTHNNQGTNATNTEIDASSLQYYYIFRYMMFNQDSRPLITNINAEVKVRIIDGEIMEYQGKTYRYTDFATQELGIPAMLPPNYYSENPYVIFVLSLDDAWSVKLASNYYPKYVFRTNYNWSIGKTLFTQQLKEMFATSSSYSQAQTIFLDFFDLPRAKFHSSTWGYNVIELLANFSYADWQNGAQNYKRYSLGNAPYSLTGSWTLGSELGATNYEKIKHSTNLVAVLSNNVRVPLNRLNSIASNSDFSGEFSGVASNPELSALYFIRLNQNGTLVACGRRLLSSDTVENVTVVEFRVID